MMHHSGGVRMRRNVNGAKGDGRYANRQMIIAAETCLASKPAGDSWVTIHALACKTLTSFLPDSDVEASTSVFTSLHAHVLTGKGSAI